MLRVSIAIFICLVCQSTCLASQQTWLDTEFVEKAFLDVALKNEYSKGNKPLVKWTQPITIWVDHRVGDSELHDELTNAHIKHLAKLTKHPIYRVDHKDQANVIWVFSQASEWLDVIEKELGKSALKNTHGAICKAGYRLGSHGEIRSASVIIPVDQARSHGKLVACIVEEITQVMGLPNDSETAYPSIFNDRTPEDLLSPLDVVLLKLLYEPNLTPGMSKQQVQNQIKPLLKQYKKDGTLSNAVSTARSGELYQLLGY